jgi:hypothetical protein
MYEHIKYWVNEKQNVNKDTSKVPNLNLFISDEEWDLWNTDRKKWEDKLSSFAKSK